MTPTNTASLTPAITSTYSPTLTPTTTATLTPTITPTPPVGIVVFPNPFDPDTAVRGTVKITGMPTGSTFNVYTVSGEIVKSQMAGNGFDGYTEWDGKNNAGQTAATGIYLYVVRSGSQTLATGSLIIRRGSNP
jgi:hypothetical protein